MNIKSFIDQFSLISNLPREQQFVLLEKARDDACLQLKFLNFATIAILIRFLFILVIVGGISLLFGFSAVIILCTLVLSLLFSRVAITEINTHLMLKSLRKVLAEDER